MSPCQASRTSLSPTSVGATDCEGSTPPRQATASEPAPVIEIVDGDGLVVDLVKLRLSDTAYVGAVLGCISARLTGKRSARVRVGRLITATAKNGHVTWLSNPTMAQRHGDPHG
jgi:hypothetical protein